LFPEGNFKDMYAGQIVQYNKKYEAKIIGYVDASYENRQFGGMSIPDMQKLNINYYVTDPTNLALCVLMPRRGDQESDFFS